MDVHDCIPIMKATINHKRLDHKEEILRTCHLDDKANFLENVCAMITMVLCIITKNR